jgi:hypothetical protein
MACRFIQNSGLVPKKRRRRRAVSAVTVRSLLTIAAMRVVGTRRAKASAFIESSSGLRNSSASISPGWVVARLGLVTGLMGGDDFGMLGSFLCPYKTHAPLIIDAD